MTDIVLAKEPVGFRKPGCVLVGSSTGGPYALLALLERFSKPLPVPLVIVQHIRAHGLPSLVKALANKCCMPVAVAEDGEILKAGHVYVSDAQDQHLSLRVDELGNISAVYTDEEKSEHCRPAVNVLFKSMAECSDRCKVVATVLTGMGKDGAEGAKHLCVHENIVIAQDEVTSVVWGMPRAVVETGVAHRVLPIEDIASTIEKYCA